jgi:transposase
MCIPTLRIWVRQDEGDDGARSDRLATVGPEELTALRKRARDLRRANEIPKAASVCFARRLDQPSPR